MNQRILSLLIISLTVMLFLPAPAFSQANNVFNSSGLDIPRFVSLRSDKVFVRTGPALRYPIKWVYKRKNMPVEIIQEFDTWRKIKDIDGEEGWIHQSLLSGRRHGIAQADNPILIFKKPDKTARSLAEVENDNVLRVHKCETFWCDVEIKGFSGWIEKKSLWGVYQDEEFD